MCLLVSLYAAILFFVLVPGILLTLPKNGTKFQVAAVHALVFALIFHFTHKLVWRLSLSLEGFQIGEVNTWPTKEATKSPTKEATKCPPGQRYYDLLKKCVKGG